MSFSVGGPGEGEDFAPISEMNIVPLVDVMLVLLIISMITTPFMEQGVNVELPVAGGQGLQKSQQDEPLILFVSRDRKLKLGSRPVTREELPSVLLAEVKGRKDRELFVRADRQVPYGFVAEIMSKVQSSGVERVGLVTQPE